MEAIHPTAIVAKDAVLGDNVRIGPHSIVEGGVTIGSACAIGPHVVIHRGVTLGAECRVHAGAVLGDEPQDRSFKGGASAVRIGDGTILREGVTVHRGTEAGTETVIGKRCFLMAYSHFAHNVVVADNVIVANGAMLGGYVEVDAGTFISGNAMIHQFVKVGRLAMVAGGSAISKDLPPFCMTLAVALNTVIGLNTIGMRRAGFTTEERQEAQRAFKVLFLSGCSATQAATRLKELFDRGPGAELAAFIDRTSRGLCGCAIRRTFTLDV